MRLVYKRFDDGKYTLYQTDDEGRKEEVIETDLPDDRRIRRVPVYIEISCDEQQVEQARDGLERLVRALANPRRLARGA